MISPFIWKELEMVGKEATGALVAMKRRNVEARKHANGGHVLIYLRLLQLFSRLARASSSRSLTSLHGSPLRYAS